MTQDDRISAYIDNELTSDQEQEFLISLAASEGLRKSFRSELVLKNVLHRDESITNPPRGLRTAVFATLGLATSTITAEHADAAQVANTPASAPVHGLVKTLFATKINALLTAATLSITALVGYGVHSVTSPSHDAATHVTRTVQPTHDAPALSAPALKQEPVVTTAPSDIAPAAEKQAEPMKHSLATKAHRNTAVAESASSKSSSDSKVNGVFGGGSVEMKPPITNSKK